MDVSWSGWLNIRNRTRTIVMFRIYGGCIPATKSRRTPLRSSQKRLANLWTIVAIYPRWKLARGELDGRSPARPRCEPGWAKETRLGGSCERRLSRLTAYTTTPREAEGY